MRITLYALTLMASSAAMLLDWLSIRHKRNEFDVAAKAIDAAINSALQKPETRTPDIGGKLGTQAFAKHVASLI